MIPDSCMPPRPDPTIPTTDAERRVWAGRVLLACRNGENIEGTRAYETWTDEASLTDTYHEDVMEFIYYQIVVRMNLTPTSHTQHADRRRTLLRLYIPMDLPHCPSGAKILGILPNTHSRCA